MENILAAALIYVLVFGADYVSYLYLKKRYNYVSRRTWGLFIVGQIGAIWYFLPVYAPIVAHLATEAILIGILGVVLYLFALALMRDQVLICQEGTRTLRCLSPGYVWVKGADIMFQQLIYYVIALSLVQLFGIHVLTYLCFTLVLLIIHTVVILGGGQRVIKSLTFGLIAISVPIFYVFTDMELFWPAVYLHAIMYVFYWLVFADFDR